jgi:DNA-binding NarL/FixJ family response regulator
LMVDGADTPTIARRMDVSVDTVKCHLRRIYLKSGYSSRVELALAVERNWVEFVVGRGK